MNDQDKNFHNETMAQWENLGNGISRQIMGYNDQLMMVKVKFEKGSIGYLHQHFHSQATYVAAGVFEVNINEKKQLLQGGDGFFVEPNCRHGVVCIEEGTLVDVFNPLRTDFLQK